MSCEEILRELEELGQDATRKVLLNHGAPENVLGVKIEYLKNFQKKIKKNHELSLELFASGVPDAQYLAGLIADEKKITPIELTAWVQKANWSMLSEYTVPWVTAETVYGWELGLQWIRDKKESVQAAGWSTLASWVSLRSDEVLDLGTLKDLLQQVEQGIASAGNRVRYTMNGFVISTGGYVEPLTKEALAVAKRIGKVQVNVGNTACKVPYAPDYIEKMTAKGVKKKKMARC